MSDFQDAASDEGYVSYVSRVYRASERAFYMDVEKGNVPLGSQAYRRFFTVNKQLAFLAIDLIKELRSRR